MKDDMDILMEGLYHLRRSFMSLNMTPPEEIILKTHSDGMRLIQLIGQNSPYIAGENGTCKPIEHPDGSVWMQFDLMGIKIRFPANRYAIEAGGYVWV